MPSDDPSCPFRLLDVLIDPLHVALKVVRTRESGGEEDQPVSPLYSGPSAVALAAIHLPTVEVRRSSVPRKLLLQLSRSLLAAFRLPQSCRCSFPPLKAFPAFEGRLRL